MEILDRDNYRVAHLTDGKAIPSVVKIINRGKADGVNLNCIKNFPNDINDLKKTKSIKYLQVNDYTWDYDYSVINELSTLEVLDVYTNDNKEINFSNFPLLHSTAFFWRPKASSIYECRHIKRIFIGKYNEQDLLKFKNLKFLKYLRINAGSIKTLDGIDKLENLRVLELMQATKLEDISGIEKLKNLEHLRIENCRNIKNIELLSVLKLDTEIEIIGTTPKLIKNKNC